MFNQGLALHQSGRLDEAERVYRQILATQPRHFDALHLLGVIHAQRGAHDDALRFIGEALKVKPQSAVAHNNRGLALESLGRFREALAAYDKALSIKPDFADAIFHRGNALEGLGRHKDALAAYDKAIQRNPGNAEIFNNRGTALLGLERWQDALASFDKALSLRPGFAEAFNNRSQALRELNRPNEALASIGRALAVRPNDATAHYNLGLVLNDLKRREEAVTSYKKAVEINPFYVQAFSNLGTALLDLKRTDEALASYDKAISVQPDYAEAHFNRGNALQELKRFDDALAGYDRAIALKPGFADAFNARGTTLKAMNRQAEALASYERAIRLNPKDARNHFNRALVLEPLGRYEEAIRDLNAAIALGNNDKYVLGYLAHLKMQICDWAGIEDQWARLIAGADAGDTVFQPFTALLIPATPAQQLAAAKLHLAEECPVPLSPMWRGERYDHDRIRIAYVSADFRSHATPVLMAELFERHDREKFEWYGISLNPSDGSPIRKRLEDAFENLIDGSGEGDEELARLIRTLEIDILVDLNGYTKDARPGIFAHRPAPIQVSYLGYPGTLGADFMDYIIADHTVITDAAAPFFGEKMAYLPDTYQVNDSKRPIAEPKPARADAGLPEDGFVFCCFNGNLKITPQIFAIWMELLHAVEGSVLWLYASNPMAPKHLVKEAEARGIAGGRLVFAQNAPLDAHLSRLRLADLVLDTLPYNAHTTASDALWAGAPLLTCIGETFPSRVAAGLLKAVGLPELITHSLEDYKALALKLAREPALLAAVREKLARSRDDCALFDIERFGRHVEAAYISMWERHRRGETPETFSVDPIS